MRRTSMVIKGTGFALPVALSLLAVYALLLPGEGVSRTGWSTITTAVMWLTPVVVLTVASARWPSVMAIVLSAAAALFVGLGLWYFIDPTGWDAWEGPDAVRAAIGMVLLAPIAVLGLRRTSLAGVLLLVVGSSLLASMLLTGTDWQEFMNGPEASVSMVSALSGVLYLLSDATARITQGRPGTRSNRRRPHAA